MTDGPSRRPGLAAEAVSGPPAELRRAADRGRRRRRIAGGTLALLVSVAVMVGPRVLQGRQSGEPSPATVMDATPTVTVPSVLPIGHSYHLALLRDRNVVIAVETTGWSDRVERTMEYVEGRAIPSERDRCGADVLPCGPDQIHGGAPEGQLLVMGDDPMMTPEDWLTITGQSVVQLETGEVPDQLFDCIAVSAVLPPTWRVASYSEYVSRQPSLTEFVMQFDSVDAAAAAMDRLRAQIAACQVADGSGRSRMTQEVHPTPAELARYTPIDEFLMVFG